MEHNKPYSILKDKCFEKSWKILEGKSIELRRKGGGKQTMKSDVVTEEEEELLSERDGLHGMQRSQNSYSRNSII